MTRPLLLILLAHGAAAQPWEPHSLDDIIRVERTLTFPGWRRVARETRRHYIDKRPASDSLLVKGKLQLVSDGLETMKLKQRLHDGDRSHPCVVALDETKASLSYPGWRSDAAQAEMVSRCPYLMFPDWDLRDPSLIGHMEFSVMEMKRKQEYHEVLPPNVLTAVCLSGASQVGHCLHSSRERFGYWPTLLAVPLVTSLAILPWASFVPGHCLHSSRERFGYWPTLLAVSLVTSLAMLPWVSFVP